MMIIRDGIVHPMSVDEQNIALESALLESEVNYATIHQPLSFSESILYAMWEQYYTQHTEQFRELTVTSASATAVNIVPLDDAFRCITAQYPSVGNISIQTDTAGLTIDGLVSVEYIQ